MKIFKSPEDFLKNKKGQNGFSQEFLDLNNLTIEEAQKSLVNCSNCYNCLNCQDCINCVFCVNCKNCQDCKHCINVSNLEDGFGQLK